MVERSLATNSTKTDTRLRVVIFGEISIPYLNFLPPFFIYGKFTDQN